MSKNPRLICPECGTKGQYETDPNLEVYCIHCGLIIHSPYPYCAGIRYNTLEYILLNKKEENKQKRLNRKRWRKENDRIKKLQKI